MKKVALTLFVFRISSKSGVHFEGPSSNVSAIVPLTVQCLTVFPYGTFPNVGRGVLDVLNPGGHLSAWHKNSNG